MNFVNIQLRDEEQAGLKRLAAKHRVSISTMVRAICVDALAEEGMRVSPVRRRHQWLTEQDKLEILSLVEQGIKIKQIAGQFNKSPECIYNLIKRTNVQRRRAEGCPTSGEASQVDGAATP